ncbi:MAG: protein kinase [Actinomycetota bacterium]|nr:protein kinase [Actinomycetota bacterium]
MPLVAGRYRLGESLGEGGMGKVWRARDVVLDRDVAVKEILLPDELGQSRRRTLREARAAARLGHPNVVQIFDVFEVDGRTWIVMEYVPSRSLQEVLRTDGPMAPRRAARIGLDLLSALRAAHAAGVDHRDVKPANVLLADDGRVLLTDFGIATIEGDSLISSSDMLLGSPEYMSPERAKHGAAGLAADLWSLGATLYAAVEGQSPFRRGNALATLTALAADEPDPPRQAGPLEPLLLGLLRKDPASRPDAAAVEHQLRAAVAGAYGHALVPVRDSATTTSEVPPPPEADAAPAPAPANDARPGPDSASDAASGTDGTRPGRASADSAADRTSPADDASEDVAPASAATPPSADQEAAAGPSRSASSPLIPAQRSAPPSVPAPAAPSRIPDAPVAVPADPVAVSGGARPAAVSGARPAARRWIVAGSAVVAVLLAAVVWAVTRPDAGGTTPQGAGAPATTTSTQAAAPGEPQASSTPSPTPSSAPATSKPQSSPPANVAPPDDASSGKDLPTLPDGWRDYRDSTGFAVYVPEGWTRTREKGMVYFRQGSQVLGIDQTRKPAPDPVADWRGKAEYRVSIGDFPSYREIHIKEVDYFDKAADWEFTFTRNGIRQHVNNRGLITSPNQAYGIYWQTRDADWNRHRDDLQLVFDSFRPAT